MSTSTPYMRDSSNDSLYPAQMQLDPSIIENVRRYTVLRQNVEQIHDENNLLIEDLLNQNASLYAQLNRQQSSISQVTLPYISVILHGSCMALREDYARAGTTGGEHVAAEVYDTTMRHLLTLHPLASPATKVYCQLYTALPFVKEETDFCGGFTNKYSTFDVIPVWPDTNLLDKITTQIKHNLENDRCKLIVLGCSLHPSLISFLANLDQHKANRIMLIKGLPMHDESLLDKFQWVSYDKLFRTPSYPTSLASPISLPTGMSSRKSSSAALPDSRMITPSPRPCSSQGGANCTTWAAKVKSAIERSPSPQAATIAASSLTVRKVATPVPVLPSCSSENIPPPTRDNQGILRTHLGSRIDPPPKQYNKEEVNRIKKMKLCNVFYLRGPCPYDSKCGHRHDYSPKKGELETLRLVARMAPCDHGTECDDSECIYGHVCPAPDANERTKISNQAREEGKTCIFGENCRFNGEMHFKV